LKNKKPSGNTVMATVSPNLNSYDRRYPDGKKTKSNYQKKPHP
jgi:hypothetical protein